jgi:ferredoxin, 2Fe-2S
VPKVIYVAPDGTSTTIDGTAGDSVMATAVRNGVPGIIAECGGNCSCATCHVYVDDEFIERVGPPGDLEDDLLDLGTASERRPTSRLSCQIELTADLDGLTVEIPEEQQ